MSREEEISLKSVSTAVISEGDSLFEKSVFAEAEQEECLRIKNMTGYRLDRWGEIRHIVAAILTLGMSLLFAHWFQSIYIRFRYQQCVLAVCLFFP